LPEFVDPYLEPASSILRNKLGITDQRALDVAEADLTEWRRAEMLTRPVKVTGDLRQLRAIHGQLFQDVYDWAGQLRTVDIRKGTDADAEFFMPVSRLESGAGFAFAELAEDKQLRGLDRDRFVDRLAHHYDQVNYLHPFREGNGRTQRIFWTQVAAAAGYDLDWSQVTGAENDRASRDAMERREFAGLHAMFDRIVRPSTPGGRLTPERLEQLRIFASMGGPASPSRGVSSTPARPARSQTQAQGYGTDLGRGR
jgi:cell filamentation protein